MAAVAHILTPQVVRQQPYRLTPHESALRPGFDPAGFNRLVDEVEDEAHHIRNEGGG